MAVPWHCRPIRVSPETFRQAVLPRLLALASSLILRVRFHASATLRCGLPIPPDLQDRHTPLRALPDIHRRRPPAVLDRRHARNAKIKIAAANKFRKLIARSIFVPVANPRRPSVTLLPQTTSAPILARPGRSGKAHDKDELSWRPSRIYIRVLRKAIRAP